jgi:hypothetical protein
VSRFGLMGVVEKGEIRGSPSFHCLCVDLGCASFGFSLSLCSLLLLC